MSCWDGFGGSSSEPEREGAAPWEDPDDGDLSFLPNPEAWEWDEAMEDLAGPEYKLRKKRKRKDEDGGQEQ